MQRLANQLRRTNLHQVDDNSALARAAQPEASGNVAGSSRASVAGLPARVRTGAANARQSERAGIPADTPPQSYDAQLAEWASAAPAGEEGARRITVERIQRVVGKWLVRSIDLSELGLTSLPPLPKKLKELDASGNKLTELPVLPSELTYLCVCKNRLTALPDLPVKLKELYVRENYLITLPTLPQSLESLYADGNFLTTFPTFPRKLKDGDVSNNPFDQAFCPATSLWKFDSFKAGQVWRLQSSNPNLEADRVRRNQSDNPEFFVRANAFRIQPYAYRLANWIQDAPAEEVDGRRKAVDTILKVVNSRRSFGWSVNLNLSNMGLKSLPELPDGLRKLECRSNELTTLLDLSAELESLDCSWNRSLVTLPALPASLRNLKCNVSMLTVLPELPASLSHLDCSDNRLTVLPELPASLSHLDCSDNRLTVLPGSLANLNHLDCSSNRLTVLPELPARLISLYCDGNQLTTLPALPTLPMLPSMPAFLVGLQRLSLRYNPWSNIPSELVNLGSREECAAQVRQWQSGNLRPGAILQRNQMQNPPPWMTDDWYEPIGTQPQPPIRNPVAEPPRARILANPTNNAPSVPIAAPVPAPIDAGMFGNDMLEEAMMLQRLYDMADRPVATPAITVATERQAPAAPILQAWDFPETETNASSFNAFHRRLADTQEYRNPASRPSLTTRVDALVADMRASPALRTICFNIAADATQTCGDRVALALNDMQLAQIDHKAINGHYSLRELFSMGEGFFKLDVLDQIAVEKMERLTRAGVEIDPIEVRLAYQTELSSRLTLPGVTRSMLFRVLADVSPDDISAAERQVVQKLERGEAVDFLVQWRPWQQALERHAPEEYERVRVFNQPARDAIACQPRGMTEQRWRQAFDRQAASEAAQIADTTDRLTRAFMEEHDIG